MKKPNLIIVSISILIVLILFVSLISLQWGLWLDPNKVDANTSLKKSKDYESVAKDDQKQEPEIWDFLVNNKIISQNNKQNFKIAVKFIKNWAFTDVIEMNKNGGYQGIRSLVLKKENNKWAIFDGYNYSGEWEHTNEMPEDIKKAFITWDSGHY